MPSRNEADYLAPDASARRPLATRRRRSKSPERRRRRSRDYHSDTESARHRRRDEREEDLRPVRTRSHNKRSSAKQVPSPIRMDRVSHSRVPSPPRLSFPSAGPLPFPYGMPPPPPTSNPRTSAPHRASPPPPLPVIVDPPVMPPPRGPRKHRNSASSPHRVSPPPPLPVIVDPPRPPENDSRSSRSFRESPPSPPIEHRRRMYRKRVPSPPPPPGIHPGLPVPPSAPVRPSPPPFHSRHSYPWAHASSSEDDDIESQRIISKPRRASPPSKKRIPSPQRHAVYRPNRRSDPVLPFGQSPPTFNKPVSTPQRPSPAVLDADSSSVPRDDSDRITPTTNPQVNRRSPSPTNQLSTAKKTPSPPPDDRRKSFPVTPQSHASTKGPKAYRPISLQVPFPVPGGFPTPPDTVRPDDSRSVASSQPMSEMRSWSRSAGSLALSGSTSRPPLPSPSLSSGTLGIKTYQYVPLGDMEFRLVRILPARSSKIKCEIIHASIEDPPEFVSISYAWGDADDTRKIILEGATIPVAASLHGALEALREKKDDILVWVDALCIDQQNRDERTQQVQLMTSIYTKASYVAIWLGSEADDSNLAVKLLEDVAKNAHLSEYITDLIKSGATGPKFPAVVALFERDYWRRLWVVQEVFNAKDIWVYCGSSRLHWNVYRLASNVFWDHKADLDVTFPGGYSHGSGQRASQNQFTYSQVLAYQGPSSIPDVGSLMGLGEESLLEVMRACRRKLSADARDKVFGILGVLPEDIRSEFPVDYNLSVKEVYINVVDHLLVSTERLDVICESIHFPLHTSSANLPSWAPDWSHVPETASMSRSFAFSASAETSARHKFIDERRRELEISAVYLDTISAHGIAVGTLCTLADYLMAFVHWRALLLGNHDTDDEQESLRLQEAFCRTLCLNQVPQEFSKSAKWLTACYHVFSSLMRERLPKLPLDRELRRYTNPEEPVNVEPRARRRFLQEHFGSRMMGRCFCLTEEGRIGIGTGFMAAGDVVIVPLGCSTPILIRPEGPRGQYRFVGDVYIHDYMHGKAIEEMEKGKRVLQKYVLH